MKTYIFIFEDRNKNELTRKEYDCFNLKDAKALAVRLKAESLLNDLYKINVKVK